MYNLPTYVHRTWVFTIAILFTSSPCSLSYFPLYVMIKFIFIPAIWLAGQFALAMDSTSQGCDATCQYLANLGATFETAQHAEPNSSFYTTPFNFSRELAPGAVLAVEYTTNLTNYQVPYGLTMSRIIYTTTDLNGTVQPASAYILWPYVRGADSLSNGSTAGFPLVAWAHGTSGNFPTCAPSNYRGLQYNFMVPFALAMQGVAVVAPDYAGLGVGFLPDGTPIQHEYAAAPAQANDLANAVIAARTAFPEDMPAEGPFVAAGHSQGGGVSWAFAQRQAELPVPGYKGAVAFAPFARPIPWFTQALSDLEQNATTSDDAAVLLTVQNKVIAGITAVYPAYNYSGLTDASYGLWHGGLASVQGCLPTDSLLQTSLPLAQLARANWTQDPTVQEFMNRTVVGSKNFVGPVLVLGAELDSTVALNLLEAAVDETCQFLADTNATEELEFVTYGQVNHFPLIQASHSFWMGWIKDHLSSTGSDRRQSGSNCKKRVVDGFRMQDSEGQQSITPNWLVTGVPATEAWKYSL